MSFTAVIPIAVCLVGTVLLFKLGGKIFLPWRFFRDAARLLKKKGGAKNLSLALAGTLGVGNVVGVAVGIEVGGAGSVFWLAVSAVPCAVIKYAESSLALDFGGFGMASVSRESFPRFGAAVSSVYTVSLLILSLTMGAGLQSAAVSESLGKLFGAPPLLFAILLAVLALAVMLFGRKRIRDVTSVLVPAAAIIYVLLAVFSIAANSEKIPDALRAVAEGAFTRDAALGGCLGTVLSLSFREGFLRGILSNEAGLGTSSIAHSEGSSYTPHEAGIVGILEVTCDTLLLCPLTALMLLVSGDPSSPGAVEYLFSATGGGVFGCLALAVSVFFFAFSTVVSWIFYGSGAQERSFPRLGILFKFLFLVFLLLGGALGSRAFVGAVDLIMIPLAAISLATVLKNSDRAVTLSERGSKL